ncbi:hypothetical protein [Actinokineospora bangkokensis]|uniref:Uncharacterized protein n=1 Tax=Actinokineospora bangkokensis TaxID=1193682 RepID=A0A1Q9LC13_9PSEU|nr:hypothetical protein [Actinokineospora bangkokensis]OLR89560.1 hypothetical protein BJP25_05645 [Actinokineospora bangkokensis]
MQYISHGRDIAHVRHRSFGWKLHSSGYAEHLLEWSRHGSAHALLANLQSFEERLVEQPASRRWSRQVGPVAVACQLQRYRQVAFKLHEGHVGGSQPLVDAGQLASKRLLLLRH